MPRLLNLSVQVGLIPLTLVLNFKYDLIFLSILSTDTLFSLTSPVEVSRMGES